MAIRLVLENIQAAGLADTSRIFLVLIMNKGEIRPPVPVYVWRRYYVFEACIA